MNAIIVVRRFRPLGSSKEEVKGSRCRGTCIPKDWSHGSWKEGLEVFDHQRVDPTSYPIIAASVSSTYVCSVSSHKREYNPIWRVPGETYASPPTYLDLMHAERIAACPNMSFQGLTCDGAPNCFVPGRGLRGSQHRRGSTIHVPQSRW